MSASASRASERSSNSAVFPFISLVVRINVPREFELAIIPDQLIFFQVVLRRELHAGDIVGVIFTAATDIAHFKSSVILLQELFELVEKLLVKLFLKAVARHLSTPLQVFTARLVARHEILVGEPRQEGAHDLVLVRHRVLLAPLADPLTEGVADVLGAEGDGHSSGAFHVYILPPLPLRAKGANRTFRFG